MHPIFSIFSPGNNSSSTLFGSIHSDHVEMPAVALQASEEQRFNKFHLHWFESLTAVLEQFPDRQHRILYPVRRDVERQVISAFIRYAGKIEKRPDRLGLPHGRWSDWTARDVVDAFERFMEVERMPFCYADFHRHFLKQFDISPEPLKRVQIFERAQADVLLIPSEMIPESTRSLAAFVAPAKFTLTTTHRTSNDRAALVKLLLPRAHALLASSLKDLRAEFPAFYRHESLHTQPGVWAQLCSVLHLPFGQRLGHVDA